MTFVRASFVLVLCIAGCGSESAPPPDAAAPAPGQKTAAAATPGPQSLELPGLKNVVRVNDKLYCGSQPQTPEAFAELQKLGVKTVICIDAVTPLAMTASQAGLKYVHIPCGFQNAEEMAPRLQAALDANAAPFYVHCHNGRPRTPALVAMLARSTAGWNDDQVRKFLDDNGVTDTYPGLRRAALEYRPSEAKPGSPEPVAAPTKTTPVAQTMASLLADWDPLQAASAKGFATADAAETAALAQNAKNAAKRFDDLAITPIMREWDPDFVTQLKNCAKELRELDKQLQAPEFPTQRDAAVARFKAISAQCGACHKQYRN
jgi:protein tyrosine phosphatase (PTP) superfamily phosphohydrolase (DUF442 family)